MGPHTIVRLLFVASTLAFPFASAAQSPPPAAAAVAGRPQTEPQKRGEAAFAKNCHLCHIYSGQKQELKILASTLLIGLFKEPTTTEAAVRQRIQQGIPRLMPSFQYNFEPSEMDDLIAYLKIR